MQSFWTIKRNNPDNQVCDGRLLINANAFLIQAALLKGVRSKSGVNRMSILRNEDAMWPQTLSLTVI